MKNILSVFALVVILSSCGEDTPTKEELNLKSIELDKAAGEALANDKELEDALDNAVEMPDFEEDTTGLDLGLDDEDFDPESML